MINGLSEGDRIEFKEILLKAEEQSGRKAQSYVSQIFDFDEKENVIRVAMPISKGKLVPLPKDEVFDTYFYTKKGLYHARCRIIDRYKSGSIYTMRVALETELQKYQRRQYYRLEKTFSLIYSSISEEEYIKMLETKKMPDGLMQPERYAEGTALDISGGGIRFVGKNLVPTNQKVLVIFDIFTSAGQVKFRLPGTVILSFELSNHVSRYEHRIEFENISKEYREILIKYIFEEERKMRKGTNRNT